MTRELLHAVDFVTEEQYYSDDWEEHEFATSEGFEVPLPRPGDIVDFGFHKKNGEIVDELTEDEAYKSDYPGDYGRTGEYEVVQVKHHYHSSRIRSDPTYLMTNRLEVTTKVIVRPIEDEKQQRGEEQ